jgi:DNA-binding response OmpR family regulator
MAATSATVLVVDDEPELGSLYAEWLGEAYDVRVATSGTAALDALDADVDVALLDRRMPGLSGDDVLDHIVDGGYDCWVAMVTAVEPDVDIVEMSFDDYLLKPVTADAIRDTVAGLLARSEYDAGLRNHFGAVSKWAVLTAQHSAGELSNSREYRALERAIAHQRAQLDEAVRDLSASEFRQVLGDVVRGSGRHETYWND